MMNTMCWMFERKASRIAASAVGAGTVKSFCKRDTAASSFLAIPPGKEAAMPAPIKPQIALTAEGSQRF